uniref:thioredoxin-related transmembrane protein 1-like isoform X2 n=1 Tax=Myxine glutinosa TaxID=7769 RepID=UPI00358FB17F
MRLQCRHMVLLGILAILLVLAITPGRAERHSVVTLTDQNWTAILRGEWMVEFYAPWCPACQRLQRDWQALSTWSEDLGIHVAKVDITVEAGLGGRFLISSLPTIYHIKDGEVRLYEGHRTENHLLAFIEGEKWKLVEPLSYWRSPSSLPMAFLASIMRLSVLAKDFHNYIIETLELPQWMSYAVFGLLTIGAGLILGLIFVLFCESCFPSNKQPWRQSRAVKEIKTPAGEAPGKAEQEVRHRPAARVE